MTPTPLIPYAALTGWTLGLMVLASAWMWRRWRRWEAVGRKRHTHPSPGPVGMAGAEPGEGAGTHQLRRHELERIRDYFAEHLEAVPVIG